MPGDFGDLAVNTRVHFTTNLAHARLRVRLAPGIPHALCFRGEEFSHHSDATRRENAKVRSAALRGAKATKQSSFLCAARWIASLALAMTEAEFAHAQHSHVIACGSLRSSIPRSL
jgi:hypothetical protein